jgi:hypothetical protein
MQRGQKFVRKRIPCLVAAVFLSVTRIGASGEQGPEKPVSPKVILFTGKSRTVGEITLKAQLYKIDQFRSPAPIREWGSGLPVDIAIRSLELSLGKTNVKIPPQAYSNLLNVTPVTVTFREDRDKVYLYMKGGDGAQAYETRIEIAGGVVKQRETVGAGFAYPQPPYERITFKANGRSSYSLTSSVPRNLSKPRGSTIKLGIKESS